MPSFAICFPAEIALPANATGALITSMAGDKQMIAFSIGRAPLS